MYWIEEYDFNQMLYGFSCATLVCDRICEVELCKTHVHLKKARQPKDRLLGCSAASFQKRKSAVCIVTLSVDLPTTSHNFPDMFFIRRKEDEAATLACLKLIWEHGAYHRSPRRGEGVNKWDIILAEMSRMPVFRPHLPLTRTALDSKFYIARTKVFHRYVIDGEHDGEEEGTKSFRRLAKGATEIERLLYKMIPYVTKRGADSAAKRQKIDKKAADDSPSELDSSTSSESEDDSGGYWEEEEVAVKAAPSPPQADSSEESDAESLVSAPSPKATPRFRDERHRVDMQSLRSPSYASRQPMASCFSPSRSVGRAATPLKAPLSITAAIFPPQPARAASGKNCLNMQDDEYDVFATQQQRILEKLGDVHLQKQFVEEARLQHEMVVMRLNELKELTQQTLLKVEQNKIVLEMLNLQESRLISGK